MCAHVLEWNERLTEKRWHLLLALVKSRMAHLTTASLFSSDEQGKTLESLAFFFLHNGPGTRNRQLLTDEFLSAWGICSPNQFSDSWKYSVVCRSQSCLYKVKMNFVKWTRLRGIQIEIFKNEVEKRLLGKQYFEKYVFYIQTNSREFKSKNITVNKIQQGGKIKYLTQFFILTFLTIGSPHVLRLKIWDTCVIKDPPSLHPNSYVLIISFLYVFAYSRNDLGTLPDTQPPVCV